MKILVTGSNGSIGKNLITTLHSQCYEDFAFDHGNDLFLDIVDLLPF